MSDEPRDGLAVYVDTSLPAGTVVLRREGESLTVTREQLHDLAQRALDALAILGEPGRVRVPELPYVRDAWELGRQNARLREQNRLLGERFEQQERVIRGAFARAVRGLSGDRPAVQRDADDVVRIVEDHYRAEQLLREHGLVGTVARGVRQLLDERHRVVETRATERPPEVVPIVVEPATDVGEVNGTYSITSAAQFEERFGDSERPTLPELPSKP